MGVELIERLGLPVAIVVAFGYFFVKRLWPWMTEQTEAAQAQASKAVEALGGMKEVLADHNSISVQIVERLKELQQDVRSRSDARPKRG